MSASWWLVIVHVLAAVGAVGLWLVFPSDEAEAKPGSRVRFGAILSWFSLGGLVLAMVAAAGGLDWFLQRLGQQGLMLIFAGVAIASAARVITHRSPIFSALYFVLTVLASSGMLLLINAVFLGVAIIIIYAGAILVTYVFVIMLATQGGAPRYDHSSREPLLAAVIGLAFGALVAGCAGMDALDARPDISADHRAGLAAAAELRAADEARGMMLPTPLSNMEWLGLDLLGRRAVALEVAGLLLLVSMVGGIAIARRRADGSSQDDSEVETEEQKGAAEQA